MSTIKQHRPAYFSGFENQTVEFNSLQELLDIEFVSNFKNLENFYRYSISAGTFSIHLIGETDEGYSWWVVGYIDNDDHIKDLPVFEPKYKTTL